MSVSASYGSRQPICKSAPEFPRQPLDISVPIHEIKSKEKCAPKAWSQPLFLSVSSGIRKPS